MLRRLSFVFKKIREKLRYGLIMHVFYDYLAKVGIDITPFYWMKEALPEHLSVDLIKHMDDFEFSMFTQEDIDTICRLPERTYIDTDHVRKVFKEGKKCYGAKVSEEIAGFTWINLDACESPLYQTPMNTNEAYLFDMYILKKYRGRKFSALLRYKTYDILKKMGRDTCYSITVAYNAPSIKFKKKLNAQYVFKAVRLNLFHRLKKTWIIKRY